MTRKQVSTLAAALKKEAHIVEQKIQKTLNDKLHINITIEDTYKTDKNRSVSGMLSFKCVIKNKDGWSSDDDSIHLNGTIGLKTHLKRGKKKDEAYLEDVQVGDWFEGSKSIKLNGCGIGEFLTHIFIYFAIKAGNLSVLLDNAAGKQGLYIYTNAGFIKSKGERVKYGDDNEMIIHLTGKKKNKAAGDLWRERYKKLREKIKNKKQHYERCVLFWKKTPPMFLSPRPVTLLLRGVRKNKKTKKRTKYKINGKSTYVKSKKTMRKIKNRSIGGHVGHLHFGR